MSGLLMETGGDGKVENTSSSEVDDAPVTDSMGVLDVPYIRTGLKVVAGSRRWVMAVLCSDRDVCPDSGA